MTRRMARWSCVLFALGLFGAAAAPAPAHGQSYPSRVITIVVPAAPGGVSDTMARLVAQRFMTAWGQQVIVENRGGANHAIGARRDDHINRVLGVHFAFRGNDLDTQRHQYLLPSSIPATQRRE